MSSGVDTLAGRTHLLLLSLREGVREFWRERPRDGGVLSSGLEGIGEDDADWTLCTRREAERSTRMPITMTEGLK